MGCIQSKVILREASVQTEVSIEKVLKNVKDYSEEHDDAKMEISQYGDGDQEMSVLPTLSEAADEIRYAKKSSSPPSPPSSQSHELAADPINIVDNEEKISIDNYIKAAVEYRNDHGGKCDLDTQMKKQRLELICVGAFIINNRKNNKYEIISYDSYIPNSKLKYRPDLILRDNETKMIVHVEIDEHGHSAYDQAAEELREKEIADHFCKNDYMRIRFNPNSYGNKLEMAISFAQILRFNDGLLNVRFQKKTRK